jgi:hypothetical protein
MILYKVKKLQSGAWLENDLVEDSDNYIPTIADIKKGGYKVKVIAYAPSKSMPPGHTEALLIDQNGKPVRYYYDKDNNKKEAFVNRWEEGGDDGSITGDDNAGHDNVWDWKFGSKKRLDNKIAENEFNRAMDINLNPAEIENFLNNTSKEGSTDYKLFENNCANGVCRAFGADPETVGSTFGFGAMGMDPAQLFSTLEKNYKGRIEHSVGKQLPRDKQLKQMVTYGASNIENEFLRNFTTLLAWQSRDAINAGAGIYKGGRYIKQKAEDAVDFVDDNTDFSSGDGASNFLPWWGNTINGWFGGNKNYWNYASEKRAKAAALKEKNSYEFEPRDVTLMRGDETRQGPQFYNILNLKKGGLIIKYQTGTTEKGIGEKVAEIAVSSANKKLDGGRKPLNINDHINAYFDKDGLCRDNTCVQTVKDFYNQAGIKAMPDDVYNNTNFLDNYERYGFTEVLDGSRNPGDIIQYYYEKRPFHMGVYTTNGKYVSDGSKDSPIQEKDLYKDYYLEDGVEKSNDKESFRIFRYTNPKKGEWLQKGTLDFKDKTNKFPKVVKPVNGYKINNDPNSLYNDII